MKAEYNLASMKSRKNPFAVPLKQQSVELEADVIGYFKNMTVDRFFLKISPVFIGLVFY